ncbi:hypothetical protein OC846_006120 [Tilletia horrida]|uniref:UDENN domain-containing protein n=1 Tax=Tilletia horrida TaxID=155126 RepID=A0AAN6GLM2_9BASI|nr:hypothetical protein OC846_006120 [Tilletia horrida]
MTPTATAASTSALPMDSHPSRTSSDERPASVKEAPAHDGTPEERKGTLQQQPQLQQPLPQPTPPLRNKHCHFVLLAEFDIDRGSTLAHQYPAPIGHDDHILAELMLPDGAHARSEDWTVFFLKQTSPRARQPTSGDGSDSTNAAKDPSANRKSTGFGTPADQDIVYVLNLVRTKHDTTVRRGAMVKAMCIGTSHPYIQIFRPALLLALDDYFADPGMDCLARLYEAINDLDLTAMPVFSNAEKLILRASERRDLFEERFVAVPRRDERDLSGPKDTRFFDTSISFRQVSIPIRLPLTTFPEEVGEYSLLKFIQTFSGPNSAPSGPQHPHLHSNGSLTHPIIILFNAMATQKRVIFLGHGQPANDVATFVLSACALGSGCGAVFRGFTARAFPYANLTSLDEMEKVPGYIAGVTNPRFEDLPAWDVICNIETGKITISKDIEPASLPFPINASGHSYAPSRQGMVRDNFSSGSLSYASGSVGNSALNGFSSINQTNSNSNGVASGGQSIHEANGTVSSPTTANAGASSSRAPSEADSQSISGGYSGASTGTAVGPLSRTGTTLSSGKEKPIQIEGRADALDNLLIDDLVSAIQSRYGETYIRARIVDYAIYFSRVVSRHEEHYWGSTKIGWPSQPFLNGQLGSGLVYPDREMEMREIQINAMRAEGWRNSSAYPLFRQDAVHLEVTREIRSFDVIHQIQRLRRAKQLSYGESDLIFASIAKAARTPDQIVELLSYLPAHNGGLSSLAYGLYHPAPPVRNAMVDFFANLFAHPVARKFISGLSTFHRLALARMLHERNEAQYLARTVRAGHGSGSGAGPHAPDSTLPQAPIVSPSPSNGPGPLPSRPPPPPPPLMSPNATSIRSLDKKSSSPSLSLSAKPAAERESGDMPNGVSSAAGAAVTPPLGNANGFAAIKTRRRASTMLPSTQTSPASAHVSTFSTTSPVGAAEFPPSGSDKASSSPFPRYPVQPQLGVTAPTPPLLSRTPSPATSAA